MVKVKMKSPLTLFVTATVAVIQCYCYAATVFKFTVSYKVSTAHHPSLHSYMYVVQFKILLLLTACCL